MSEIIFNQPERLLWLPLAGILAALCLLGIARRRRDVAAFVGAVSEPAGDQGFARFWRPAMLSLAAAAIIVALAGPASNPHPKQPLREGRELVFVLDVSNSMLADDIPPNRLVRAKAAIEDCVRSFDSQRVGLAVFAGIPAVTCPLTLDYDFFSHALAAVGPASVEQGGTRIEDALLLTCKTLLADATQGYRDIVLISDGGDQGDSTAQAVDTINSMGVKLIVIGIGSSGTGARVPDPEHPGEFLLYRGEEVWTKLEADSLRRLAGSCTQGVYLPVGTSNMDLGKIYQDLSRQPSPPQFAEQTVMAYDQRFQIFVTLAFALLAATVLMPERRSSGGPSRHAIHAAVSLILTTGVLRADPARDAAEAFRRGAFERAVELYAAVAEAEPSPEIWYNLGNAHYRQGDFAEAVKAYRAALTSAASGALLMHASYNLANAHVRLAEKAYDRPAAIRHLDAAVRLYRRVLWQDPAAADAGINLELALRAKAAMRKAMEKARDAAMSYKRDRMDSEIAKDATRTAGDKEATGALNNRSAEFGRSRVPPPTESPDDILDQQVRLRERRGANTPGARRRVRTDW